MLVSRTHAIHLALLRRYRTGQPVCCHYADGADTPIGRLSKTPRLRELAHEGNVLNSNQLASVVADLFFSELPKQHDLKRELSPEAISGSQSQATLPDIPEELSHDELLMLGQQRQGAHMPNRRCGRRIFGAMI